MKSSKFEYRIVTAQGGLFQVEMAHLDGEGWCNLSIPTSLKEAKATILWNVERDDFTPTVIEWKA